MNLSSSAAASARPTMLSEPPLSPGAAPISPVVPPTQVAQPMSAPEPVPARPTPPLEAQLVRLGLLTPDQVATLMREEAETGRAFLELVREHEWVKEEDLARLD